MKSGLQKILDRLKDDPSNKVLSDRYLQLVADLSDSDEKADCVYLLAKVFEVSDPQFSMQLSYMVFQYSPTRTDALMLVSRCLKQLGRHAKAEVLMAEAKKLASFQPMAHEIPTPPRQMAGFSMEVSKLNVDGVELLVSEHSRALPAATDLQTTEILDPLESMFVPQLSNPVPKSNWSGPDLGVLIELFDFYHSAGKIQLAKDLLQSVEHEAKEMTWWQERSALLNATGNQKNHTPEANSVALLQEQPPVEKTQFRAVINSASESYAAIDQLILERNFRRALHEIRRIAKPDMSVIIAAQLYQRYQQCCAVLGFEVFEWSESEGSDSFCTGLSQRPRAKAG